MKNYLTAICFFHMDENKPPWKYRNIRNRDNFMKFIAQHGVMYVNFYSKETKAFVGREWVNR